MLLEINDVMHEYRIKTEEKMVLFVNFLNPKGNGLLFDFQPWVGGF